MGKAENERFKRECEAVKNLGEEIGYGNMMDIASALWAKSIRSRYGLGTDEGAFYATIKRNMKPGELTDYCVQRREDLIKLFAEWDW